MMSIHFRTLQRFLNLHSVHPCLEVFLQVLFVEAHGGNDGACGPVDHDICEEIVKTELSTIEQN